MRIVPILVIATAVVVALWVWWRYFRIARPRVPPLELSDDDPLIAQAMEKARATIGQFRSLYSQPHRGARCKVPFHTSSGVCEYLWAEVRKLGTTDVEVLYLTPPVTHEGRLERVHTHAVADIVDWQVERPDGRYSGGFTMRAMFIRGREQWGQLPPEVAAEEKRYADEA
jgi:uncharacterized protein YegJ (DUF2314 family)